MVLSPLPHSPLTPVWGHPPAGSHLPWAAVQAAVCLCISAAAVAEGAPLSHMVAAIPAGRAVQTQFRRLTPPGGWDPGWIQPLLPWRQTSRVAGGWTLVESWGVRGAGRGRLGLFSFLLCSPLCTPCTPGARAGTRRRGFQWVKEAATATELPTPFSWVLSSPHPSSSLFASLRMCLPPEPDPVLSS